MDRLYTSISTAKWLLEKNIISIGTLMSNRIGIPPTIKSVEGRDLLSSKVYWEEGNGDMVITLYVVNTSKGKKNILVFSTVRTLQGVFKDDDKFKPAIYANLMQKKSCTISLKRRQML